MRIIKLLAILSLGVCLPCYAGDIKAIKTNTSFEEVAHIDQLQQIKINEVPRTTYTPKNLRTQYNMSFQGKNTTTGAMTYWSSPINDYDTKILDSQLIDDSYYIFDNTGKQFKTGEHVDLSPIQNSIQNIGQRLDDYGQDLRVLDNKVNNMQRDMYSGLATVTALTSLHPNPRSTDPIELSIGAGMYRDQCAGAVGLFIHPTQRVMIQGGASFGNSGNWAGFVGMTFSFGKLKRK